MLECENKFYNELMVKVVGKYIWKYKTVQKEIKTVRLLIKRSSLYSTNYDAILEFVKKHML